MQTQELLMKVLFDTKKVQKLGRISFSEQLLRNAGLQEGDAVNIYFDASTKCIVLERVEKEAASSSQDGAHATKTRRKA
jgi:bifunctional DNA-binding transcriptional regulator/antitoxin component of YhaV-PrlF toxin-antitoxin module